jgi:hypothetical protein
VITTYCRQLDVSYSMTLTLAQFSTSTGDGDDGCLVSGLIRVIADFPIA